jgi:hypothetical protein
MQCRINVVPDASPRALDSGKLATPSGFEPLTLRLGITGRHLPYPNDPDKAVAEAEAKLELWRLHDLRRSVSTGLGKLGFAPHIIEMVLNHISGEKAGVSGLYNRSRYEADCRRALAAWARAVTANDSGANVVQLRENLSTA